MFQPGDKVEFVYYIKPEDRYGEVIEFISRNFNSCYKVRRSDGKLFYLRPSEITTIKKETRGMLIIKGTKPEPKLVKMSDMKPGQVGIITDTRYPEYQGAYVKCTDTIIFALTHTSWWWHNSCPLLVELLPNGTTFEVTENE